MTLHAFAEWLGQTPLSLTIQNVTWIIPAVQSVHILCIAIVVSSPQAGEEKTGPP